MKRFEVPMILLIGVAILFSACGPAGNTPAPAAERQPPPTPEKPEQHGVTPATESQSMAIANLKNYGPAPELTNTVWLNTEIPLRLANLRRKVVLINFWTFDCINCQHVIPSLKEWHTRYNAEGLVIIGNHYPEFDYEADLNNLQAALRRLEVPYAVAQDNDGQTWSAYQVRYWPTLFLIDKQGDLRYTHIGEGHYSETESAIKALLAETP